MHGAAGGQGDAVRTNVLSVDVEDYFQVEAFARQVRREHWASYAPRVESNVGRVLDLFARRGTRGTFFILGWIATRFPMVVRQIAAAGHEVGCHGFAHQHIARQTPEQFREDIRTARDSLMSESQTAVQSYRAPSFSITKDTLWALDVLAEEGFRFDSSMFPVHHDLYGIPDGRRFPYWHVTDRGNSLFEFPPSTVRVGANNYGVGGGGYLRFAPCSLTCWAIRRLNGKERQPAMVYFHPWEIDPGQPRIAAPIRSRVRHYTNLAGTEAKLDRLLQEFRFSTLAEVCRGLQAYEAGAQVANAAATATDTYATTR